MNFKEIDKNSSDIDSDVKAFYIREKVTVELGTFIKY